MWAFSRIINYCDCINIKNAAFKYITHVWKTLLMICVTIDNRGRFCNQIQVLMLHFDLYNTNIYTYIQMGM